MALIDVYNILYEDSTLQARVVGSAFLSAVAVQLEDAGTANHAARVALADEIFVDPLKGARVFLKYVAANSTIRADPDAATDSDLDFVVASNWTTAALADV